MAISIRPLKNAVSHEATIEGRSYVVRLIAQTTVGVEGPIAIRTWLADEGFVAGSYYQWPLSPATPSEQDFAAQLQSIRVAEADESGRFWNVDLHYATRDVKDDGPAQGGGLVNWVMSPTAATPTIAWSSEDAEYFPIFARDGKPILNTAGDAFSPSPSIPLPTPIATISRVESGFLPAWITLFKGTLNDAEWMGFPAESVLCKDITANGRTDPDHGYLFDVVYTFAFRPSIESLEATGVKIVAGWDVQVLNTGMRELKSGKREEIKGKDGQPISEPVPLTSAGTYNPEMPPEDIIALRFPVYPLSDFSSFNIPAKLFSYNPGP